MRNNIIQKYTPYWTWECYNNGMYDTPNKNDVDNLLRITISFISNHEKFGKAMKDVSLKWSSSMLNHLTNKSINRKAFIGQCAVNYELNIQESITRKAWKELTDNQRILANIEAEKIIKKWEFQYMKKFYNMKKNGSGDVTSQGYQMKLLP